MTDQVAGFPYWEVAFDENGQAEDSGAIDRLVAEVPGQGITDLFIFSHGWNNDATMARSLYTRFFQQMRDVLGSGQITPAPGRVLGTVGVLWPSMRWPDEPAPGAAPGGAASLAAPPSDAALVDGLAAVFDRPEQRDALEQLGQLLDARPSDLQELARFQQLMAVLTASRDAARAPEDNGDRALLETPPERLFDGFADATEERRAGGAAGLGDSFGRLWDGAKAALRAATYWEMKKRAGVVGQTGLGPLVGRLQQARPDLRVHLLGHSFGARLVSFALAGLPEGATSSPVKSVVLLQGAFSHFAFAARLPQDPSRSGALAGRQARVDGPLLVSHSLRDTAVGDAYPLASIIARDDASAADDLLFQWGAMGHDGAQGVDAAIATFGPMGQVYTFAPGAFLNLDGNALIVADQPLEGAHGDIFHPEIAWAALAAARVA
jgi:hypothetical protein